jgi:hypothetical protein
MIEPMPENYNVNINGEWVPLLTEVSTPNRSHILQLQRRVAAALAKP